MADKPLAAITPKIVAVATDRYLTPSVAFPDPANLPGPPVPRYGQDITYGQGRPAPRGKPSGPPKPS